MKTPTLTDADTRGVQQLKADYIEAINEEMQKCEDLELLDLIYKLLVKSSA